MILDKKRNETVFRSVTLWIFLITISSYAVTLVYQSTYFAQFGISDAVLSFRTDPYALLLSAIILLAILFAVSLVYALLKFIPIVLDWLVKLALPAGDIIAFLYLIYIIIFLVQNNTPLFSFNVDGINKIIYCIVLIIDAIYIVAKGLGILYYKFKNSLSWKQSYIYLTPDPRKKNMIKHYSPSLYLLAVLILLGITFFPQQLAREVAIKKIDFVSIKNIEYSTGNEMVLLVIGQTNDGYIVKKYDTIKRDFDSEYSIIMLKNLTFGVYTIK